MRTIDVYSQFDEYGNNINFSDDIVGTLSTKSLIGKWTNYIMENVIFCLYKYYSNSEHNTDAGNIEAVRTIFTNTIKEISMITPILSDLINPQYKGLENILITVYGVCSDEIYAYETFINLAVKVNMWNENDMWNDANDNRIAEILYKK